MQITKIGQLPSERQWRGICYTCKSMAIANESELNNIHQDFRDGTSFSWEKCPFCGVGGNGSTGMLFYPLRVIQN